MTLGMKRHCRRGTPPNASPFCWRGGEPLPAFDENATLERAGFDRVPPVELVGGWNGSRRSNLSLLRHLPREAWMRRGVAAGEEVSMRALAWIMAGHVRHHLGILRERYLERIAD